MPLKVTAAGGAWMWPGVRASTGTLWHGPQLYLVWAAWAPVVGGLAWQKPQFVFQPEWQVSQLNPAPPVKFAPWQTLQAVVSLRKAAPCTAPDDQPAGWPLVTLSLPSMCSSGAMIFLLASTTAA